MVLDHSPLQPHILRNGNQCPLDVLTAEVLTLQNLLTSSNITSRQLVDAYLAQIKKHDGYLHAMIQRETPELPSVYSGNMMPSGWQPAYVREGVDPNDSKVGHSSPAGSLSGSAVGVSAGYAPLSIGTETDGSLICPAGRAALYAHHRSAVFLDAIAEMDSSQSFTRNITGSSWENISVGTLDPVLRDIEAAYQTIELKAKKVVRNLLLPTRDTSFQVDGRDNECGVRSLQDIIDFNKEHADQELPPHFFLDAQKQNLADAKYSRTPAHLRKISGPPGIDKILKDYGVDVIIGYPVAGMPLSYLEFNGRPLGMAALAGKGQDALLVKLLMFFVIKYGLLTEFAATIPC
ncbi:putative glutamyl-tRNA amidotransferase subunit A [Apodospora peruviana]|uniref:Glutamyl-tRNA amidotransferase subunit A n=1 Tax=Apodospora peruviana TaxID=516989 RepID=A0AAE0I6F9_9PEZI|nr:putative glutamyl-tRNA amidotransferase subunit A [Apodospora peruviana]